MKVVGFNGSARKKGNTACSAWIMKVIGYKKEQFPAPAPVAKTMTNFIR